MAVNIQMNILKSDNNYEILNPSTTASITSYSNTNTSSIITGNNVQSAIDQLFTSVSNGKTSIASAITDKGVSTSGSDSFSVMANNIKQIETENVNDYIRVDKILEKDAYNTITNNSIDVRFNLDYEPDHFYCYMSNLSGGMGTNTYYLISFDSVSSKFVYLRNSSASATVFGLQGFTCSIFINQIVIDFGTSIYPLYLVSPFIAIFFISRKRKYYNSKS